MHLIIFRMCPLYEMTAKEWFDVVFDKACDEDLNISAIQRILDDGRRQGMLEAIQVISDPVIGNSTWHCTQIRDHAAKLFPKEPAHGQG